MTAGKRERAARSAAGGGWATTAADYKSGAVAHDAELVPRAALEGISGRLADIGRHHGEYLAAFRAQLPAAQHDEVRFLLERLEASGGQ